MWMITSASDLTLTSHWPHHNLLHVSTDVPPLSPLHLPTDSLPAQPSSFLPLPSLPFPSSTAWFYLPLFSFPFIFHLPLPLPSSVSHISSPSAHSHPILLSSSVSLTWVICSDALYYDVWINRHAQTLILVTSYIGSQGMHKHSSLCLDCPNTENEKDQKLFCWS